MRRSFSRLSCCFSSFRRLSFCTKGNFSVISASTCSTPALSDHLTTQWLITNSRFRLPRALSSGCSSFDPVHAKSRKLQLYCPDPNRLTPLYVPAALPHSVNFAPPLSSLRRPSSFSSTSPHQQHGNSSVDYKCACRIGPLQVRSRSRGPAAAAAVVDVCFFPPSTENLTLPLCAGRQSSGQDGLARGKLLGSLVSLSRNTGRDTLSLLKLKADSHCFVAIFGRALNSSSRETFLWTQRL